ncbi:MAG: MFS transporter [Dehalococcoidia bacterium]|nr:MFS transporter [Dehalococcoidia bacterium]
MEQVSPRIPEPSKPRFYYGWVIVAVIFLTGAASSLWMNASLSVLVKPITDEFEWKRSVFSGASTIGTILGGVLAFFVGPAIDRFGAKWVLFLGFLVSGLLFVLLSATHGVVLFFFIMIVGRIILQGIVNVADAVVVPQWFIAQRGRATAIAALGPRFGTGVLPFISQAITSGFGWRPAALAIGVMAWAITLAPVFFWMKRRPEDMGLRPDGASATATKPAAPTKTQTTAKPRAGETNYTLKEVLRMRGFWVLLLGFAISQFVNTGINFNLLPYLTDQGVSTTQAITVVSLWSLAALPTTMLGGFLAERIPHRYVLTCIFIGTALGVLILTRTHSFGMGLIFALIHGTFIGAVLLFQTLTFADYYGRNSLGAIRGFVTVFFMIANAFGPLAATTVFDITGSYQGIIWVYVGLSFFISACMFFAKPPPQVRLESKPAA